MFGWIKKVKHHHFLGVLSFAIGFSFITERYTITNALRGPIQLAELLNVPGLDGLQVWGVAFVLGGIFTFFSRRLWARMVALSGASFSWGIFAFASLFTTFGFSDPSGSAIGILFLAGLIRCLQACGTITDDIRERRAEKRRLLRLPHIRS